MEEFDYKYIIRTSMIGSNNVGKSNILYKKLFSISYNSSFYLLLYIDIHS
jgi:hypothetical protein